MYITADKHVKCIKCTNPSYANLLENDSKNHKENDQSVDKTYFLIKAKQKKSKQCEICNITVENENELKIHRKSVHSPIPDGSRSPGKNENVHRQSVLELSKVKENRNEKSSALTEINEKVSTVSALEKHINKVSKEINVHLEMHEITPAVGNC